MQHPSLQNVRIRSTRDALHVFYAVARNVIPLITRRLDAEERRAIVPGNVYVWEERSANSEVTGLGMERWTDGMGWGPSRVRDDFLFYHQKECDVSDDPTSAATPWAQMISMYPSPRSRATSESERLIKQTYSVRVSLPDDRSRGIFRKWHLTAYFSQQKLDRLNTIDNIQGIGDVPVPDGWFRSARRDGKSRREDDLPKSVVAKRISQAPMEGVISTSDSLPVQPSFYQPQSSTPVYTQFPTSTSASRLELSDPPGARKTAFSLPSSVDHPQYTSSSGVRQTTYSEPNLINARDHARYRDSLAGPTASICPSPPSSSSSMPATPSPRISPVHLTEQLVPLDYLQNLSYPRRDPIDEQFLQRFSTLTSTSLKGSAPGHSLSRSFSGRMKF
ncbi:Gti1/Pac2 family-domain-containing protein [Butyriboletus roseoflavus]|nr:Gti1/Pac2 family-domain-containing protein [Butyriboletus roseoflavus]